jgi:hypothetical protein
METAASPTKKAGELQYFRELRGANGVRCGHGPFPILRSLKLHQHVHTKKVPATTPKTGPHTKPRNEASEEGEHSQVPYYYT